MNTVIRTVINGEPTLKRTCMRDRIRDVLVARILDGTYPAGMQLKELTLAREFNVSQAPIREALRELEGSGLVTSERYRGTHVRGADLDEMRQSYELRATLEVRAVELAIPLNDSVVEYLETQLDEMAAGVEQGDPEHYIDAALRFHRRLIDASGNRVFVTVWDSLHFDVRGRIALRRLVDKGPGLAPMLDMHRELIDKARAGDMAGAASRVRAIFARVADAFSPE
ncbi:MAG TPA: GntR family transcriptional regulator [Steroidobacteraceae bacterium]|nr:GntR family transcriptional regulator [Steroidobacteraceae bacterium]